MTKDKELKLTAYLNSLINCKSLVSDKHKNHPATYNQYLDREIATIVKQLDEAKLEVKEGVKK